MVPKIRAAGVVLLTNSQPTQVLLLRHKTRWDLPKGHAEDGEEISQTALRETEEETGIPGDAIELEKEFEFILEYQVESKRRGKYDKQVTYFLGYVAEPLAIHLTEHIGYEWRDWPVRPIQQETLDPLFEAIEKFLAT